jgi:hypothetical protein
LRPLRSRGALDALGCSAHPSHTPGSLRGTTGASKMGIACERDGVACDVQCAALDAPLLMLWWRLLTPERRGSLHADRQADVPFVRAPSFACLTSAPTARGHQAGVRTAA